MTDQHQIVPAYPQALPAQYNGSGYGGQQQQRLDDEAINPRDAWNSVQRNKWLILFCIVLVVGGVGVFTELETPIYQAQVSILIDDKTGPTKRRRYRRRSSSRAHRPNRHADGSVEESRAGRRCRARSQHAARFGAPAAYGARRRCSPTLPSIRSLRRAIGYSRRRRATPLSCACSRRSRRSDVPLQARRSPGTA